MENEKKFILERANEIIAKNKKVKPKKEKKKKQEEPINEKPELTEIINNVDTLINNIENEKNTIKKIEMKAQLIHNLNTLKSNDMIKDEEINNIIDGL